MEWVKDNFPFLSHSIYPYNCVQHKEEASPKNNGNLSSKHVIKY